jgi:hypothetical protein
MADEELKERDRRSPLDTIESVGMAALAIGAGAAFLYKGGGSEYLSSGLKKANQALNETLNTLSNTALRDIDYNKTKAFVNDFKSAYLRADESPTIRMNTAESLINVIAEGESKRANMSKDLYKMYDREMIFAPLTSEFQQQFAKNDSALENRIYDFVDDTLKNTKDAVLYTDENGYKFNETFLQKHFGDNTFSAEQQQQMQDRT